MAGGPGHAEAEGLRLRHFLDRRGCKSGGGHGRDAHAMQDPEDCGGSASAHRVPGAESEEEIGLAPNEVKTIGRLGTLALPSGYLITPIVGVINPDTQFTRQEEEVEAIIQAPLALILDIPSYKKSKVEFKGTKSTILELQYEDYRIWGATAAILFDLAQQINRASM